MNPFGDVTVRQKMSRMNTFPALMLLGFVALAPTAGSAQIVVPMQEQQCVSTFLAACATLHYVDFSNSGPSGNGVLTVIVANTSNGSLEPGAYIHQLLFDLTGTVPDVQALAWAQYGTVTNGVFTTNGNTENFNAKRSGNSPGSLPGFQVDLELKDNAKSANGGNQGFVTGVGDAVMVTVAFDAAFGAAVGLGCSNPADPNCQAWTAEIKGLNADGKGKGFTTNVAMVNPEPSTVVLLLTGFIGIGGAGALRRRRDREKEQNA